ncbi:helix-turn-helix domain-containing protein [Streptomyces sp. M10(2022)]
MTQAHLASLLNGRTASWMSQVERGVQPVRRIDVLQDLANALGVSTQALDPNAPAPVPSRAPRGCDQRPGRCPSHHRGASCLGSPAGHRNGRLDPRCSG